MNAIQQYKQCVATAEEIMRKHIDEALEEIKEIIGEQPSSISIDLPHVTIQGIGSIYPRAVRQGTKVTLEF